MLMILLLGALLFPYAVLHRSIKTFFASRNKCYTFIEVCKMIYVWHKKCSSAFASRKLSDFQKVKNQEISHARTKLDFCINNPYNVIVMPSTKGWLATVWDRFAYTLMQKKLEHRLEKYPFEIYYMDGGDKSMLHVATTSSLSNISASLGSNSVRKLQKVGSLVISLVIS